MAFDSKHALNTAIRYLTEAAHKRAAGGWIPPKERAKQEQAQQKQFIADKKEREKNLAAFQKGNHPEVPPIVYHGSPDVRGIFQEGFKPFSRGNVFFASDNYDMADSYADDKRAFDYQNAEPHVIPLHLSMKNPMVIDAKGGHWKDTAKHVDEAVAKGHDGLIIKNSVDYYNNDKSRPKSGTVFAWFNPSQAKSAVDGQLKSRVDNKPIANAIGNQGTFDPSNPDITKSEGGLILSKQFPTHYMPEVGRQVMASGGKTKKHPALSIAGTHIREEEHGEPIFTGRL